ncbi:hypothetical protein [Hymenobacter terrestris]|uniref:STAS/SEC14 domain-containing protein n=1 Tax=Hymenobacter terrestris TaxID=2748310 RepID=A0ABX2Q5E3_9BACT|nr:hypothetical protein [Hymenobacter terrestris]NVO85201.1 hypothetical protein [Hymenobacter terrestris]
MSQLEVNDFLDISYRADLGVLVARWFRPVNLPELQAGYEQILTASQAKTCRHWLIDVRRRYNTHQVGAHWMISDLLPRLGPALGGRTKLAYLLAPIYLRDAAADSAFPPQSYFEGKPFVGERFTEESAAIEWLRIEAVSMS